MITGMLAVAVKSEADLARLDFTTTSAAISGCFAKDGARPFLEALGRVGTPKDETKKPEKAQSAANKMVEAFKQLGMTAKKKGKR